MAKLDDCFAFTMRWEGGDAYTNDPADKGGPTKYGVTLRTLRAFTGNPLLNADDVQALTQTQARTIYFEKYYKPMRGDDLPPSIAIMAVDYAYNSGRFPATAAMQRIVGCKTDGVIGPVTLAALKSTPLDSFISAYTAARLAFLQDLPGWTRFGRGWERRVMDCMHEARKLVEV